MSSNGEEEEIDKEKFNIGSIGNPKDPDVLLISFPVKFLAQKGPDGMDEAYGKCRRLEAVVMQVIKQHWASKQQHQIKRGVIMPDGKPAMVQ